MIFNLLLSLLPKTIIKRIIKVDYAFIAHPRTVDDYRISLPILKWLPKRVVEKFLLFLPPIIFSKIIGLVDINGNKKIGRIIICPLTASQLMLDRKRAKKKIIATARFAEYIGAKLMSLGALTASLTNAGKDVAEKVNAGVTNGYALTVFTVSSHVLNVIEKFNMDTKEVVIAIVGAAGSVGSNTIKLLGNKIFKEILIIDIERKKPLLDKLISELRELNNNNDIKIFTSVDIVKEADIIVTATNLPDTIIYSKHLKSGAIIIDDAQPTDVAEEVYMKRDDVLVLEGGVVSIPNITCDPVLELKGKNDVYSCLGEVIILAYLCQYNDYNIGRLDFKNIELIKETSQLLGIKIDSMQNAYRLYNNNDIARIQQLQK